MQKKIKNIKNRYGVKAEMLLTDIDNLSLI